MNSLNSLKDCTVSNISSCRLKTGPRDSESSGQGVEAVKVCLFTPFRRGLLCELGQKGNPNLETLLFIFLTFSSRT